MTTHAGATAHLAGVVALAVACDGSGDSPPVESATQMAGIAADVGQDEPSALAAEEPLV